MFGLQTLSCLHDIPVIRSSTDTIQNVYAKAKQTSPLIRLPCDLAETVADKSLQVALNVVNPLVKPLSGSVRAIDNYAVEKLREIETKYPVINTRPEDVVNTFNERTEPVRNAVNSVRDTTTSTIQQGRETVANVASSVYEFCGNQQGYQRQYKQLNGCVFSTIGSFVNNIYQKVQSTLLWFRVFVIFFLRKVIQINDVVVANIKSIPYTPVFLLNLLNNFRGLLEYVDARVRPSDQEIAELKKPKQKSRLSQQQYSSNRQSSNPSTTVRQRIINTGDETVITRNSNANQFQRDYTGLTDVEELRVRINNPDLTESTYEVDTDVLNTDEFVPENENDINDLHSRLQTTDVERLFARLPADIIPTNDNQGELTSDQQQLHDQFIAHD